MRILLLVLGASLAATGQTRSFDTYTYVIPSGYSEKVAPRFVQLNKIDTARQFACQFGLFLAQPGQSSVELEMETEWKALIGPQYKMAGAPSQQTLGLAGLPQNLARTVPVKWNGTQDLILTVVVLRFPGRYIGVQLTTTLPGGPEGCREDFHSLLRSIRMVAPAPAPAASPVSAAPAVPSGRIPTGSTPRLYPGMPGWLPSGTGVQIPNPAIVDGKPVGLWWQASGGAGRAEVRVYLPNGVRASNPRLGGPRLYDLEGQQKQPGATGVGTFAIGGGQIVERYDGFENRYAFTAKQDSFQVGGATFRPLLPVTEKEIVGAWQGPGFNFDFKADGTLTYGTDAILNRGRYVLDGYLLQILPERNAGWVELIGNTGVFLVRGNALMQRSR